MGLLTPFPLSKKISFLGDPTQSARPEEQLYYLISCLIKPTPHPHKQTNKTPFALVNVRPENGTAPESSKTGTELGCNVGGFPRSKSCPDGFTGSSSRYFQALELSTSPIPPPPQKKTSSDLGGIWSKRLDISVLPLVAENTHFDADAEK